jgi:transaldolase
MIYLDSALIAEANIAINFGWVKGITTNPSLLAKSKLSPEKTLQELAAICPGELYYQLTASTFEDMLQEARKAHRLIGDKTVLKVPATQLGFQVVASLAPEIPCSVTAIYQASQALVAREVGAKYAIAYVNRATRLLGDGLKLIQEMAQILKNSQTKILAASLKSSQEAADAIIAGADHLTVPLNILSELATNQLSENTITEFNSQGQGIAI